MRFGILGPVEVWDADDRPVSVGGPRLRALLARLLLDPGRVVGTERLIDDLYGEEPPAGAANALQSQVSRLRRAVVVELHPAGYRLAAAPDDVDAIRFERLADEGRRALAAGEHAPAGALLREALGLWRGPALADVLDAPFAAVPATRLTELRLAATEDRIEADLATDAAGLVAELQDLVAAHPLRERLRGQLMRALYAAGRAAEALAAYEDTRRTLAEELGADPSPDLAAVHLAVLRGQPAAARLPAQLASFVGRAPELDRIAALLTAERLVTLIGPGGAGKTRLALEAAGRRAAGGDEVCLVELAPLGDGAEVPQAVLAALGLREAGLLPTSVAVDPADRLAAALADRGLLLILDNCEHVVDAVARLAHRLLRACPGLRVLTTSREALGIIGESMCPVPPLPLPPDGLDAAHAADYPAVRLFRDRAVAANPAFRLDADTTGPVLRICAALDGLPLAIELAAARLRSLPAAEIATRLADRFALLSRGARTAEPRHRTLRAVVEWSWDLLDADERLLAGRLSVFAGAATPESVRRVCAPADADAVAGLVDKSLVQAVGDRYRMLDTIREFCAERLDAAGETERMRAAHAGYFLELARTAEERLRGAEQLTWLSILDSASADILVALRRSVHADPVLALRLVGALSWYWWLRGARSKVAPLAAALLDTLGDTPPDGLAEEYVLCVFNAAVGPDVDPAVQRRLAGVAALLDGPIRLPYTLFLWAMTTVPVDAGITPVLGDDPWARAFWQMGTGLSQLYTGSPDAAAVSFETAIDGFRAVGDKWGVANALDQLAAIVEWRGDRVRFVALIDEAIELIGELGAVEDTAELLCRRATGHLHAGDRAAARADLDRAADWARASGVPDTLPGLGLAELARLDGDLAGAERLQRRVLAESEGGSFVATETRVRALSALGRTATARGDLAAAEQLHREAADASTELWGGPALATAVEGLADVALRSGAPDRAALLLGAAVAVRGTAVVGDADVAAVAAGAEALLGADAYAARYRVGAALSREEVLTEVGAGRSAVGA